MDNRRYDDFPPYAGNGDLSLPSVSSSPGTFSQGGLHGLIDGEVRYPELSTRSLPTIASHFR